MTSPTKFRLSYTGAQIDELLSSIPFKIDSSYIVNGFAGGTEQVASAEDAKTLYDELNEIKDPNYFVEILENLPGFNVFTDAEKSKLDGLSVQFKGSFANSAARDAAILTANLLGGELTYLLDDGSGNNLQALQYWNNSTNTWVSSQLYKLGYEGPTTFATPGTSLFSTVDLTKYNTCKFIFTASQTGTSNIMATEVLFVTNGTDIWMTECGTIGNATGLINISASITGTKMNIYGNTVANNVKVMGRKITEM